MKIFAFVLHSLLGLLMKGVKALEGLELKELGELAEVLAEVPATSSPTPVPTANPTTTPITPKWALSNLNENCDDACDRKFNATCNVVPMKAVNDGCIMENLVEDYFSTPPDNFTCSGVIPAVFSFDPSVVPSVSFGNCYVSDGSSTTCGAQVPLDEEDEEAQRLCCCGTAEECPLRSATLPPANLVTSWRLSNQGQDCNAACDNQVAPGTCNRDGMRQVDTSCKMAYLAALFSANVTCTTFKGRLDFNPSFYVPLDECFADDSNGGSTCGSSGDGNWKRFCCCSSNATDCPVS